MYQAHDLVWLVPLLLAALALLVAARLWWFSSQGTWVAGVNLKSSDNDLRNAAFATCLASWLLALATFGFVSARL